MHYPVVESWLDYLDDGNLVDALYLDLRKLLTLFHTTDY